MLLLVNSVRLNENSDITFSLTIYCMKANYNETYIFYIASSKHQEYL